MAEGRQHHSGGILGLCELIDEHAEAIEYDLLSLGLDSRQIGTPDLDWWRLKAVIKNLPQGSALHRAINGTDALWGLPEHLLATIADALHMGNWQRGGGKGRRPKPISRPGNERKKVTKIGGGTTMTMAQARAWLDKRRSRDGD